ncbi:sulfatase [Flagellimonas pacifica]|uniref:sulfatase family protein n=1 Tax=Flagellimonas pacifica TaxID=1247520 RepID=UPI001A9C7B18|nr:sulfatase [Allomuricauda parva]
MSKNIESNRPNIIFFFTDDQAYDTQKAYGNPNVKTPYMDSLADKGTVFMRHYNTTAICMASRANVMTGQYEYKTGCNFDHGPLGTEQWLDSYPVHLKKSGYRVGFGGKFGFSVSDDTLNVGEEGEVAQHYFDFWVGNPGQTSYTTSQNKTLTKYAQKYPHSTRAYGAATIDFIRESVIKDQPFCMSLFFKAPHRPVQPDPIFDTVYRNTDFRKLPNYGRRAGEHLALQSRMGRQYPRFMEWGYDKEESYQHALRKYNQLIYGVDYAIGMVLEELKKLKIDDNTIIIFSSDNGYFNGSHGLGSKVLPYEEGTRVPMIIVDPRIEKGKEIKKTNSLSGNVDIAATILDIAGIEIPSVYDGKSLLPLLQNPNKHVRKSLPIIQVWGSNATHCLTVMDEEYKYIYWYYENKDEKIVASEELFNIKDDPYEMINLANQPNYEFPLAKMRTLYDQQLDHWKKEGVKSNGYGQYGVLFDRGMTWEEKMLITNNKQ